MGINYTDFAITDLVTAATFNDKFDELDAAIKKNNYSATAAPASGDDSADGYTVGSRWIDTTNDKIYLCIDNSAGAAIWIEIGSDSVDLTAGNFYLTENTPTLSSIGASSGRSAAAWLLDATARERIGCAFRYRGQRTGSQVAIDIWWAMVSATSGNVILQGQVEAFGDGDDFAAGGGTVGSSAATAVPGTVATIKKTTITYTMSIDLYRPGDLIRLMVGRDAGNASDTATGDLAIIAVTVRFL